MKWIEKIRNLWYHFIYLLVGNWFITIRSNTNDLRELLLCVSYNKQWYYFYCEEIRYDMTFKRWYIPDRFFKIYRYSSECIFTDHKERTEQEHKVLKSTNLVVYFPDINFFLFNITNRKRHLLNAYIDLLINEIKHA